MDQGVAYPQWSWIYVTLWLEKWLLVWNIWLRNEKITCVNQHIFNLTSVDLRKEFDHCTVFIYYYGFKKEKSSLGYHTCCVYSVSNGKYVVKSNSQVENISALIYSLSSSRILVLFTSQTDKTKKCSFSCTVLIASLFQFARV